MSQQKRVFILGAGFSKPAGMPLGNCLEDVLKEFGDAPDSEMLEYFAELAQRIAWLSSSPQSVVNIEQVFDLMPMDAEAFRLQHHRGPLQLRAQETATRQK